MSEEVKKKKKISFFKRLKMAIFNLEDYGSFLGESLTTAFVYFFILVLILSIITSIAVSCDVFKMLNKFWNYIENELPSFSYSDGIVTSDNTDYVEAYDWDYNFGLIVDTSDEVSEPTIKEYRNKVKNGIYGVIALKDRMICISNSNEIEGSYLDLQNEFDLGIRSKQDLINKLNDLGKVPLTITFFIFELITSYFSNVIMILSDVCVIAIFGWIAAKICGVNFKMEPMIALSIYSLSLSIALKAIYTVVLVIYGFEVEYFNVIYLLIAYVYIIASIFMIKYDLIKQAEELRKIIEVQKQAKREKELEESQEESKEEIKEEVKEEVKEEPKDVENPEDKEENNEPDGSEI